MITFLFQIFLKPVIEDKNMELARKCSELISDVSDGKYLHPHTWISFFKCIYIYDTYFLKYVQCSMCPSKAQIIKAQKIVKGIDYSGTVNYLPQKNELFRAPGCYEA